MVLASPYWLWAFISWVSCFDPKALGVGLPPCRNVLHDILRHLQNVVKRCERSLIDRINPKKVWKDFVSVFSQENHVFFAPILRSPATHTPFKVDGAIQGLPLINKNRLVYIHDLGSIPTYWSTYILYHIISYVRFFHVFKSLISKLKQPSRSGLIFHWWPNAFAVLYSTEFLGVLV